MESSVPLAAWLAFFASCSRHSHGVYVHLEFGTPFLVQLQDEVSLRESGLEETEHTKYILVSSFSFARSEITHRLGLALCPSLNLFGDPSVENIFIFLEAWKVGLLGVGCVN